jgi:hypothetical protein
MRFSIPYTEGLYKYLTDSDTYRNVSDVYFSDPKRFPLARGESVLSESNIAELGMIRKLGIHLNYTLNPSIYPISVYTEPLKYIKLLEALLDINVDMLTISNPYFLKMEEYQGVLSKFIIRCSALNSVQTLEQVKFWVTYIGVRHFVLYGTILRDFDELERIASYSRKNDITLTLLVNEHCYPGCPYRVNEFSWGVLCNTQEIEYAFQASSVNVYGCSELLSVPSEHMKMLGIGPNKVAFFDDYVDSFKLINRDRPIAQMKVVIDSYMSGDGSVTLNDTIPKMCPSWYKIVTWDELYGYGFFENTLNCKYRCCDCTRCTFIFETHILPKIEERRSLASAALASSGLCEGCRKWKEKTSNLTRVTNGFCSSKGIITPRIGSCEKFLAR